MRASSSVVLQQAPAAAAPPPPPPAARPAAVQQPPLTRPAPPPPSRRQLLGVAAAAAIAAAATTVVSPPPARAAAAAAAAAPSSSAAATTAAGSNVGRLTNKQVDARRGKAGFVRSYDGHVALKNKYTGALTDVKNDLQVPGLLLLREPSGAVFYVGYGGLKQVDLSDDVVLSAIAADTWESNMRRVEAVGPSGAVERLDLTREEFYSIASLVSGADGAEEDEEEGGAGAGNLAAKARK